MGRKYEKNYRENNFTDDDCFVIDAAGYAQYALAVILKVDVPFEFSVGKKAFPAGDYQVVRIAPTYFGFA